MKEHRLKDPLQEILERHLYRASTEDEKSSEMIQAVVMDYLQFLSSQGVHIPGPVKNIFVEDLKEEIRELTIKLTYGSVAPEPAPAPGGSIRNRSTRKLA
jgi:hypothetical protein